MEFEDGVRRLEHLLALCGWPERIVWVTPEQVLHFPLRATIIFRPEPDGAAHTMASQLFERRYGAAPAVSFYAPARDESRTFAFVESIEELADGEDMFVEEQLKIALQGAETRTYVTDSSVRWWVYRRQYERWSRKTAEALAGV